MNVGMKIYVEITRFAQTPKALSVAHVREDIEEVPAQVIVFRSDW